MLAAFQVEALLPFATDKQVVWGSKEAHHGPMPAAISSHGKPDQPGIGGWIHQKQIGFFGKAKENEQTKDGMNLSSVFQRPMK